MKMLILSQYWFPENGVPQRRWSWISKILVGQGHELYVIAPHPHYRYESRDFQMGSHSPEPDAEIDELGPSGELIRRTSFLKLGESLTSRALSQAGIAAAGFWEVLTNRHAYKDIDVLIGTVPAIPTAFLTWATARILRKPYVIDLRDAWPDLLKDVGKWNRVVARTSIRQRIFERGPAQCVGKLIEIALNGVLFRATAIVVTSEDLADSLRRRGACRKKRSQSVTPEIFLIRNVFPPQAKAPTRDSSGKQRGHLNVLYAGTLGRAQNLKNSIDAAYLAGEAGLNVSLRFVGTGAAEGSLKEYARKKNVAVRFDALVSPASLTEIYDWADTALVHLTDWGSLEQAVPSKMFELIASGIHISCVAKGETARLVESLEAGDVVDPEDPQGLANLWKVLDENPSRLRVGDAGIRWVNRERDVLVPMELRRLAVHLERS